VKFGVSSRPPEVRRGLWVRAIDGYWSVRVQMIDDEE